MDILDNLLKMPQNCNEFQEEKDRALAILASIYLFHNWKNAFKRSWNLWN